MQCHTWKVRFCFNYLEFIAEKHYIFYFKQHTDRVNSIAWSWSGIDPEPNIEVRHASKASRAWNESIVFSSLALPVHKFSVLKIIKFSYTFIDFKCVHAHERACACVCKDGHLSMESAVHWTSSHLCYVYPSKYNVHLKRSTLKVFVPPINLGSKRTLPLFWLPIYLYRDFIVKQHGWLTELMRRA